MSPISDRTDPPTLVTDVLADLGLSPTPYHAVARVAELLRGVGFEPVERAETLPTGVGRHYVAEGGVLVAWIQQEEHRGFTVVGAHTDSPNLRVKTNPDVTGASFAQVGVEIYGGVLLNSWLDRGLGLAGRVAVSADDGIEHRLFLDGRPIMTVPQLAIHLDREIRSDGLKLDPQRHLNPLWAIRPTADGDGSDDDGSDDDDQAVGLRDYVADHLDVEPDDILAWDLMAFDVQPPEIIGLNRDMFASGRIDNLLSTFCGTRALMEVADDQLPRTPVLALYDHEEIGSESSTGAAGSFLSAMLERIAAAEGADRGEHLAALSRSIVISADGAHATHPNYADRHEPSHHIALNAGVVVKRNANQRYATDAVSEAFMVEACRRAGVPVQFYIHRNDLPCGSTIGPITAARLGVPTVDLGAPQLAMHSAREMAGTADIGHLVAALASAWRTEP